MLTQANRRTSPIDQDMKLQQGSGRGSEFPLQTILFLYIKGTKLILYQDTLRDGGCYCIFQPLSPLSFILLHLNFIIHHSSSSTVRHP